MGDGESQIQRGWYEAEDVREAARGRWFDVLCRFGVPGELLGGRHGPCPGCGGRDRFRFDDRNGEGSFICSQGGGELLSGDGLACLAHAKGWEWKRAVEEVGRYLLPDVVRRDKGKGERGKVADEGVAAKPVAERGPKRPPFDVGKLEEFVRGVPAVTREWVKSRSRVPVHKVTAEDFLFTLYKDNERVLVFTSEYSQGDFLHWVGHGSYRLAEERGVKAVESKLPGTGKCGVWFLTNPVTGQWAQGDAKRKVLEDGSVLMEPQWSRRSWRSVTAWRYMVLESDEAPEELWLRALVKLELPIAAIYSSGGRSLHALVKVDAESKLQWDGLRDVVAKMLCPIGADGGALSAVRLSRLPFCYREGKKDKDGRYVRFEEPRLQELIYLDPEPEVRALLTRRVAV
jgi:hypothetical protein